MLDLPDIPYEAEAEELRDQGWVLVDLPSGCDPAKVLELAPAFFRRRQHDWKHWQATRPGEDEVDVGVKISTDQDMSHAGTPKDNKAHLMFADDMVELLRAQQELVAYAREEDDDFLKAVNSLHQVGHHLCLTMLSALTTVLNTRVDLAQAYRFATASYQPWATSATRVMEYMIDGGQSHIDRCAITCHYGDVGGTLFAIDAEGNEREVSPKIGQVLIFPSLKLEIATEGKLKALHHGSYCSKDVQRLAAVTFGQLVTEPVVQDHRTASDYGFDKFEVRVG